MDANAQKELEKLDKHYETIMQAQGLSPEARAETTRIYKDERDKLMQKDEVVEAAPKNKIPQYTMAQLRDRVRQGVIEPMADPIPGRHLEVRSNVHGKRYTIYIKPEPVKESVLESFALNETVGDQGLVYEQKVYAALKKANIKGLDVGAKPAAGFSRHGAGDIEATVDGMPFNIEVKLSGNDQMGAGQLVYDYKTNTIQPHGNLAAKTAPEDLELILDAARQKIPAVRKYIQVLRREHGVHVDGFPARIPKPVRIQMTDAGHSEPINARIMTNSQYIVDHYNAKGVYYIQIGGAGLFYLGSNPLDLPIPPFAGQARIEMRLKYSGPSGDSDLRRAEWVAIGRMVSTMQSPYTLDDAKSVQAMFQQMGGIVKKPTAKKKAEPAPAKKKTTAKESYSFASFLTKSVK
jgi:hypothetical protein